jgi:hypothetical protein
LPEAGAPETGADCGAATGGAAGVACGSACAPPATDSHRASDAIAPRSDIRVSTASVHLHWAWLMATH